MPGRAFTLLSHAYSRIGGLQGHRLRLPGHGELAFGCRDAGFNGLNPPLLGLEFGLEAADQFRVVIADVGDAITRLDDGAFPDPPLHHASFDGCLQGLLPFQRREGDDSPLAVDVLLPGCQGQAEQKEGQQAGQ